MNLQELNTNFQITPTNENQPNPLDFMEGDTYRSLKNDKDLSYRLYQVLPRSEAVKFSDHPEEIQDSPSPRPRYMRQRSTMLKEKNLPPTHPNKRWRINDNAQRIVIPKRQVPVRLPPIQRPKTNNNSPLSNKVNSRAARRANRTNQKSPLRNHQPFLNDQPVDVERVNPRFNESIVRAIDHENDSQFQVHPREVTTQTINVDNRRDSSPDRQSRGRSRRS